MPGIKRTPADKRYSNEVRERDQWTCQRCWKSYVPPTSALHCAHLYGRACKRCTANSRKPVPHYCTRLDPDNALALCMGCHLFVDSHPIEKLELFRERLGDERFNALAERRRSVAA